MQTEDIIIQQSNYTTHDIPTWAILIVSIIGIALFVVFILYLLSLFKAAKRVPQEHQVFPAWFVWMMLIPVAGYVFNWLMLPFGIPKSFEKYLSGNEQAVRDAKTLFGLGLTMVIIPLLLWIPFVNIVLGIGAFAVWIIYWVKVVSFRKKYLDAIIPPAPKSDEATSKPES